jgi:hypothetical protein
MTETPSHRLNAAWDEIADQEDYIRSMRHLSDDELRAQLVDTLRKEKAAVDGWLDAGDCFLMSGAGKIHLPNCPSMWRFMDRDAAWAPYLGDLERVRDWHGSDNAPPMPALLTRAGVEAMTAYKTCPVCAPALDHADKRDGATGWTVLKAGSLNRRHLGTVFSLPDGSEIGALTKITRVDTLNGTDFRVEFDGLDAPVTGPATEVTYRTGTRARV